MPAAVDAAMAAAAAAAAAAEPERCAPFIFASLWQPAPVLAPVWLDAPVPVLALARPCVLCACACACADVPVPKAAMVTEAA